MKRTELFRCAAVLVVGMALAPTSASAGKPVTINVSTTAQLYDAVQPEHAGATVLLASGVYVLDPSRANSGRLVLPPGMNLVGVERKHGSESRIVVPPLTGGGQGAIRIGDHNAVRWITVEAAVFSPRSPVGAPVAVGACIDINVLPATAGEGMSAEVSDCRVVGGTRGIRCQHMGAAAAGRRSTVLLERNEALDQGDSFGFGIQLQNGGGADGAAFEVTLRDNSCTGTRIGLFVANLGCVGATHEVKSEGNVYSDNESGAVLHGGRDATPVGSFTGATGCRIEFKSIGDTIHGNVGDELLIYGQGGGITAIGGLHMSDLATPSADNEIELKLQGTSFKKNKVSGVARDLTIFGGLGVGILPNGGNHVEAKIEDVATAGDDTFVFAHSYPGQPTLGPLNVVEARIDGTDVDVD